MVGRLIRAVSIARFARLLGTLMRGGISFVEGMDIVQSAMGNPVIAEAVADMARQVRTGGLLIYATCSLSRVENQAVTCAFLAGHPEFATSPAARAFGCPWDGAGLTVLPARHNTDGYFVGQMVRR